LRARRSLLNGLLFATAGIERSGVGAAFAGAWLLAPGEGQAIVYSGFSDSTRAFDAQGHLVPVRQYKKFELGVYIEYGQTDWLTLAVSPAYDRIRNPPPAWPYAGQSINGRSYDGLGEIGAAARIRLFQNDNSVLSLQAGLLSPGASLANSLSPFEVRRTASFELRGAAERNTTILGMESFVDAEAAYRFYTGKQPGEWRFDLTLGIRPFPQLLLMLQNFASISNGSSKFGHVSWDKLQPSIVCNIAPQWSIQIGGFFTLAGVNAGREFGPMAAIWYRF
jgi:hypothetical protein